MSPVKTKPELSLILMKQCTEKVGESRLKAPNAEGLSSANAPGRIHQQSPPHLGGEGEILRV